MISRGRIESSRSRSCTPTIGGLAYGAESPEGMKLAVDTYFAPLLVGADANAVPALMARLNKAIRDNRFAKCAVETALYDGLGKRLGLPVSELLGGRQRDSLPIAWTLASGDTARDIDEAERMLAQRRHEIFKYGGTMLEGAIGTIASAQVFATFDALQWGTELFGPLLLTEEILATPLAYRDFHLSLPSAPGLGIELDPDRVRRFSRAHRPIQLAVP
ncbi:MAG: enolase C-terminal domain-like protein [Burkholderiaceae bacterium]